MLVEKSGGRLRSGTPLPPVERQVRDVGPHVGEAILYLVHLAVFQALRQVTLRKVGQVVIDGVTRKIRVGTSGVDVKIVLERHGETLFESGNSRLGIAAK